MASIDARLVRAEKRFRPRKFKYSRVLKLRRRHGKKLEIRATLAKKGYLSLRLIMVRGVWPVKTYDP